MSIFSKFKHANLPSKKLQITQVIYNVAQMVNQVDDSVLHRAIGTLLYDVPMTRSGMVSVGLLDDQGYRPAINQCCKEHFMSRNRSGEIIVEKARSGILDMEWLVEFIDECTTVHLTTSTENTALAQIQNHPETKHLSWQEQYDMAGIELVEDPGTAPRRKKV